MTLWLLVKGERFREAGASMFPTRRDFLFAGGARCNGWTHLGRRAPRARVHREAPPETTRIRLARGPSLCVMPQYVVGELLVAEGITRVDYIVHQELRSAAERGSNRLRTNRLRHALLRSTR